MTLLLAAQDYNDYPHDHHEQCATPALQKWKQRHIPSYPSDADFEQWLQERRSELRDDDTDILTIPVVVHVIHQGQAVGTFPNISDAQVLSQIQVLNDDFRRAVGTNGHNTDSVGADVQIEFCMAQITPDGSYTNGINRVQLDNNGNSWSTNQMDGFVKPSTIWNPDYYFNIWAVELTSGLLGYAQFPEGSGLAGMPFGAEVPNTDGIVIGAQYFGSEEYDDGTFTLSPTYGLGRTATHEAGHWLGLRHIWGDGGCGVDDYCDDTPESDGSNGGCPTGAASCNTTDMIENYMDYTADYCMNIFTICQRERMRTVLLNSPRRASLLNSPVCDATYQMPTFTGTVLDAETGLPVANARVEISGGSTSAQNTDASGIFAVSAFGGQYDLAAGKWGYESQLLPSIDLDNPTTGAVVYLQPGYRDGFALDLGWQVTGDAETGAWVRGEPMGSFYQNTPYDPTADLPNDLGTQCYLTGNSGGGAGANDVDNGTTYLTSPTFDLTGYSDAEVSFSYWFATGGGQGTPPPPLDDEMVVTLSNGTQTVTLLVADKDGPLNQWTAVAYRVRDYLEPTATMTLQIEISDQVSSPDGHLVDGAIDLFRVAESDGTVSTLTPSARPLQLAVLPNPSHGQLVLDVTLPVAQHSEITVHDALGRMLARYTLDASDRLDVDLTTQPSGIYFVKLVSGEQSLVRKVVLE